MATSKQLNDEIMSEVSKLLARNLRLKSSDEGKIINLGFSGSSRYGPFIYSGGVLHKIEGVNYDQHNGMGSSQFARDNDVRELAQKQGTEMKSINDDYFGDYSSDVRRYLISLKKKGVIDNTDQILPRGGGAGPYQLAVAGETSIEKLQQEREQRQLAAQQANKEEAARQGVELDDSGMPKQEAQTSVEVKGTSEERGGFLPGYLGVYKDAADLKLNQSAVNHLFKQYHDRDANQQELDYWSGKRVGNLEDTLAKTTIFSGEEADKIREQMMIQGKQYIPNQAVLQELAQSGGVRSDMITEIGGGDESGGMLFAPSEAFEAINNVPENKVTQQAQGSAQGTPTTPEDIEKGNTQTDLEGVDSAAGGYITEESTQSGLDIIENSNLTPEIKDLFKAVVAEYPEGIEYDANQILSTFNKIKNNTIDPYFRELTAMAESDFTSALRDFNVQRDIELEAERFSEGENIRQAKEGLEKAGLTFSGRAIEELGDESAYAQSGTPEAEQSAIPDQTPFAVEDGSEYFYEGRVPQRNRLIATSSRAKRRSNLESLQKNLEKQLGSNEAQRIGGFAPIGGLTGAQETDRQQAYGSTMRQLIANQAAKDDLNRRVIQPGS